MLYAIFLVIITIISLYLIYYSRRELRLGYRLTNDYLTFEDWRFGRESLQYTTAFIPMGRRTDPLYTVKHNIYLSLGVF